MTDNFYSHLVNWLKVLLPLTALAILSTLFLLSRGVDTSGAIPYADVDVEGLAREQRITEPQFSGVANDGSAVTIRAARARPDPDSMSRVNAEDVDAHVDLTDGQNVDITAANGIIDGAANRLDLSGGTLLTYSAGYVVQTEGLTAWLDTGHPVVLLIKRRESGNLHWVVATRALDSERIEIYDPLFDAPYQETPDFLYNHIITAMMVKPAHDGEMTMSSIRAHLEGLEALNHARQRIDVLQ